MTRILQFNPAKQLMPVALGLCIGLLIAMDFYLVNFFASHLDIEISYTNVFRLIPFEFTILIFIIFIAGYISLSKVSWIINNREKVFISLLIIGFQTTGISLGHLDTSDLFFVIATPLWLITIFTTRKYTIIGSKLNLLSLALLSCAILAMINGKLSTIPDMLPLIKASLFSLLIIDIVRRKEWITYFMKALIGVTTMSAFIGIIQEILYLGTGVIYAKYSKQTLTLILEETPMGMFLRVPAFTGMHLFLANYLVTSLLIIFNVFLYFNSMLDFRRKILLITSMVLMGSALVLTFSKTNMLGLVVGIVISLLLKQSAKLIQLSMYSLLAAVLAYISGLWSSFYESIISQMELLGDIGSRLELMRGGIEGFIYKHPFIGAGLGEGKKYTQDAIGWGVHNAFILAADDTGILGLIVFCAIFVYGLVRLMSTLLMVNDYKEKTILKILLVGLIALLVNIQFQPDFLSYYNWIYIGFAECTVIVFRGRLNVQTTSNGFGLRIKYNET